MKLGFNLNFNDLDLTELKVLDQTFLKYLFECDNSLYNKILQYRAAPYSIPLKDFSEFLLKISPYLDDFLAELFNISAEISTLRLLHEEFDIIYECKRKFVQRYAIKKYPASKIGEIDFSEVHLALTGLLGENFTAKDFAQWVIKLQTEEEKFSREIDLAAQYAAYIVFDNEEYPYHSYKYANPKKVNDDRILFSIPHKLDKNKLIDSKKIIKYQKNERINFDYSESPLNLNETLNNAHYCIYCHKQEKDSCSRGFVSDDNKGCPLKQKISEMNYVKAQGFNLSALAIIVIDNPMVAATGHRICNDCSNSCIYQKQEPVNIPLIESNILEETLKLPYGLEIYLLLVRWNPLNIFAPLPAEPTNYNVLVTGLGPAGFSLSYYLLRSGHNVVAIDGLKIAPLNFNVKKPIKYWYEYKEQLAKRVPQGFGGVAEYGITVRWDKNNLDILRLILERNNNFKYYGAVRLGSNIIIDQASEVGFDHISFCLGAGQPKILEIENFSAKGVKTASDFLMTLQNNGAFLEHSNTNMIIRMPIAVIGGGLTSIDAATESLYYYKIQVKKFFRDYNIAVKKYGERKVQKDWSEEDREIASEFINHAKLFQSAEDTKDKGAAVRRIFSQLGGSTIYYRGNLQNSPAYKLNHEELMYAMALGINFVENVQPIKINVDKHNYAESIDCYLSKDNIIQVKARTVIMAIGIENNQDIFDNKFSYFGDYNPKYSGSVVKALASTKEGYEIINKKLTNNRPKFMGEYKDFFSRLDYLLISRVKSINILTEQTFELVVHSPLAATNFKPGQFFRLQNYSNNVTKLMEPLALSPANIDVEKGLIYFVIKEKGKSSSLCKNLSENEIIALMGPTGEPTEIPKNSKVVIIGDTIESNYDNERLPPIISSLKENNCEIIYYYEKREEGVIALLWDKNTSKMLHFKGSIIEAIKYYKDIHKLSSVNRVIATGSILMIEEIQNLKNEVFGKEADLVISANTSMQCMMKGICGQCIQKIEGPEGSKRYIFACGCQEQNADIIDFSSLEYRLQQNSVQEKLQSLK